MRVKTYVINILISIAFIILVLILGAIMNDAEMRGMVLLGVLMLAGSILDY